MRIAEKVVYPLAANGGRMNSIATDYRESTRSPLPYLRAVAETGFSHVHWCHQWNTDFLYSAPEVAQIQDWLDELDLGVTDIHASAGREKGWVSEREYERLAGVELVANRMEMAADLACDVIVLHIPAEPEGEEAWRAFRDLLRRSLDALQQESGATGVRIAFENLGESASWLPIAGALSDYPSDFVGLCYDSGHGNISGDGLDQLAAHSDRLIALHLHDNDGSGDQHTLPFTGTVDWQRLAELIAQSSYRKWANLEVSQSASGYEDEDAFLREALSIARRLDDQIARARAPHTKEQ